VIKGLNVAYGVKETRPWWQVWGIAIGLTFGLGLAAATVSIVLIAGTEIGKQIAAWLNLSAWDTVWNWLRVPLIVFMLAVLLSFFYWAGPDRRAPYRFLTVGSVLTVVLWGVASWGLGIYFERWGGYVVAYGVLGALMGFLFWLFVMSLILLFGGQLNAILEAQWAGATPEEAAEATQVDYGATRAPREQPLTPAPAPATASIQDEIRGWETRLPSAEAAARQAMANPSGLDRWYRRLQVTRLLVASAIAGVAAAIIGTRGRS
jgi:uncharacterized BrkB/YihY/UPF0761 family membrane protein